MIPGAVHRSPAIYLSAEENERSTGHQINDYKEFHSSNGYDWFHLFSSEN